MVEEFIEKLESIGEDEKLDRSTMIRKLLEKGYREYLKEKTAEIAEITIWDMERYLIERGYISEYSAKDLMDELENL